MKFLAVIAVAGVAGYFYLVPAANKEVKDATHSAVESAKDRANSAKDKATDAYDSHSVKVQSPILVK